MIYGSAIASFTIESFGTNKIFNLSKQEIDNRYKILKKIAKIWLTGGVIYVTRACKCTGLAETGRPLPLSGVIIKRKRDGSS